MRRLGDPISRRIARPLGWYLPRGGYIDRVLATKPIAYWVQGEIAGVVAVDQINSPAQDGTYIGVTLGQPGIGDGNTAPFYDGVNDWTDIKTAALQAAFDGDEGSMMAWGKVSALGVWTDGTARAFMSYRINGNNQIYLRKSTVNNTLDWLYRAGGTIELRTKAGMTETDWINMLITWSASAGVNGEVIPYYNGIQEGVTMTNLGVWAGVAIDRASIGRHDATQRFHGWLGHGILWDRPLTPTEALSLGVL